MSERICFVGLDVHARRTAGAAVQLASGEVFKAQIPGPPVNAIDWMQTLPGPVRAVYEAGPTGFGLARSARQAGIEMMVCAPGAIPRQPGDRVKTDTRGALKLARLLAAGQLRPVVVPDQELETLRDLVRCREDLRGDLTACRHRVSKLLLLIAEQANVGPWAPLIARLRCLRGIDTLTAIGLLTEVGDFTAFSHPRRLASFVGLVPSENSSGDRRRQGAITKSGSSHA